MPFDLNGKGSEGKAWKGRQEGGGNKCWKDTRKIKEKVNEGMMDR